MTRPFIGRFIHQMIGQLFAQAAVAQFSRTINPDVASGKVDNGVFLLFTIAPMMLISFRSCLSRRLAIAQPPLRSPTRLALLA